MRALKIAGAAIAAVIVVVAVLLFVGIPSGFLTSAIQDRVERETGYRLTIAGSTKIGLWPSLNVKLHDITLQDPKDRDTSNRVTVGGIEADMTLASVWSGHPKITELVITRPVLYHPLLRERERAPANRAPRPATSAGDADANALAIDRVTIVDGTVVMSNVRDRVENRIEGINAEALIGADRKIKLTGSAKASDQPLKFEIKATAPTPPLERQNIPVEFMIASGLLQGPVSGRAEVRLNSSIIMVNGLTGTLGDGAFNGWASFDLASKPLVKVDLDFQRLGVAMSQTPATTGSLASAPWSNASIDLNGLNYFDAQIRISAAELNIGEARFAPVAIDTAIAAGMLRTTFSNLGVYGGQGSGEIMIDASAGSPTFSLNSDLVGVRALPLLRSAADFDKLDGKMQAKMTLHSAGNSQRAILSNLGGTVFAVFQDGAIRGLNVAAMVRSLTSGTLSGWQEGKEQTTDLTQLSASFRVEKGQATTTDLNLVGPLVKMTGAGTIDVAAKAIAFRVEPKVVMTTEGQGRASDSRGHRWPVGTAAHLSRHGRDPRQSRCGLRQAQGDGQGPVRRQRRPRRRAGRIDRRRERQCIGRQRLQRRRTDRQARRNPRQLPAAGHGPAPQPIPHAGAAGGADPGHPAGTGPERSGAGGSAGQPGHERGFKAAVQSLSRSSFAWR
jgi:AsmA protein